MFGSLRLLYVSLCLFLLQTVCVARAQTNSTLRGVLVDPNGSLVANVPVELHSPNGTIATTFSGNAGEFRFMDIAPGEYSLIVPAENGFAAETLSVKAPNPSPLTLKLRPDSVTQTITVDTGSSLSTAAADNKDAIVVSGETLRKLPVFDQDYVSTLLPFLDASASGSDGATIMVDGVEMKGSTVSPSAIAELKVNNDPYSAEFSRPGRGRIDIITKPGSPEFHGELNFIARDAAFNARNHFDPTRPPEQRRIYEGHLTGPIGNGGHTTFLISGDRKEDDSQAAVHAYLPQGLYEANVFQPRRDTQLNGRISHDFSDAHRFSVAYNFDYGTRLNVGVGGLVLPEAGANTTGREDDLIFTDRIIVTPKLLNQLQVTLEKDEDNVISVTPARSIQVQDSFTAGGAQADLHRTENTVHISDVVSWTHNKHYVRFGANVPQMSRRAVDDRTNRLGTFNFSSLADYNNGTSSATPYVFAQQAGPGRGLYWINEIAGFVQDEIKLRPDLQLTVGLRYQWQTYMDSVKDFSPRASVAYSINKKTLARAGAGIFFDRTGGDYPATFKLHNGFVLRSLQLLNPSYPDPFANSQGINTLLSSLVRMGATRSPYTLQDSISIERQLTPALTLTAGYRGMVGVASFRSRDVNAPVLSQSPTSGTSYARPNPAFGQVQQIEATGRQISNAFEVSIRGRAGRWLTGQGQYAFSRSYSNTAGINAFPENQFDPNSDWGRADYDRLHRFNLLANINPDHWLTLGIATALYSGAPYNELSGVDSFHTGLGNARPIGVPYNSLQGTGTANVDLLWDHDFKLTKATGEHAKLLSLGVSAFNVLNRTNYTHFVGTVTSPLFGQATSAAPGRQMQFAVGYQF